MNKIEGYKRFTLFDMCGYNRIPQIRNRRPNKIQICNMCIKILKNVEQLTVLTRLNVFPLVAIQPISPVHSWLVTIRSEKSSPVFSLHES